MADKKIPRSFLAHYIDADFGTTTPKYVRLGKHLQEFSIELNPEVDTGSNIWGENYADVDEYKPQGSIDPYVAYEGDPLFARLEKIINERLIGDELKTTVVDIRVNENKEVISAYREDVTVVPKSYGGKGSVKIPFDYYYIGNRVKGDFDVGTKTFTPAPLPA